MSWLSGYQRTIREFGVAVIVLISGAVFTKSSEFSFVWFAPIGFFIGYLFGKRISIARFADFIERDMRRRHPEISEKFTDEEIYKQANHYAKKIVKGKGKK